MPSSVLGRKLPSISECGFWETEFDPPLSECSTRTILTDVGNDILYGVTAKNISDWVETTLGRVVQFSSKVAMAQLPMASLRSLTERRYRFFRRILFPKCKLGLSEAMSVGDTVTENLESISREADVSLLTPPREWYGIDPIHIRKRFRTKAWSEFLRATHCDDEIEAKSGARDGKTTPPVPKADSGITLTMERTNVTEEEAVHHETFELRNPWLGERLRIWRHKPLRMWRKNVELVTGQPTAVIGNSELWLF
jgi:hypothetical protein